MTLSQMLRTNALALLLVSLGAPAAQAQIMDVLAALLPVGINIANAEGANLPPSAAAAATTAANSGLAAAVQQHLAPILSETGANTSAVTDRIQNYSNQALTALRGAGAKAGSPAFNEFDKVLTAANRAVGGNAQYQPAPSTSTAGTATTAQDAVNLALLEKLKEMDQKVDKLEGELAAAKGGVPLKDT